MRQHLVVFLSLIVILGSTQGWLTHTASAAAPTAAEKARGAWFAKKLLARWNSVEAAHGFPADRAACQPYGEAVFLCEWRVWWPTDQRWRCHRATIGTDFREFRGEWVTCAGPFRVIEHRST